MLTSLSLFYIGMIFAWVIICPVALKFFASSAPNGVLVMFDIGDYLDFIVTIMFASGIAFQIPILTQILIKTEIMSLEQLTAKRKHIIVIALIIGMLLAPPDVISQLLLSIPMWILFEMGLLCSRKRSTSPKIFIDKIQN